MSRKFLYSDPTSGFYTEATGYETSDFISTSAGVADSNKPVKTNGSGLIDITFKDPDIALYTILASTSVGQGSALVGSNDAGNYYVSSTVEGQLQEVGLILATPVGVTYTVGAGGVTKGDLCYISANDTVLPFSTITTAQYCIGLAASTVAAAGQVRIQANDSIDTVLTGATAGSKYYWSGTASTTTIPSTTGQYVWRTGVAKSATALHVECEFLKVNN